MSGRFEKIIATAVLAGALALTACSEEEAEILPTYDAGTGFNPAPTSPGGGGPDTTPPVLLSARTIGNNKVELTYSEPMQVGPAAAGMFSLNRNNYVYGANFIPVPVGPSFYGYVTNVFRSFPTPATPIGIASVTINSVNPDRVMLNLVPPLVETDDGGTGMLRLSFTNGPSGVQDQAGNPAPPIALPPPNVRGNVDDRSFSPAIIDARTINANTVELTFNKQITAPPATVADFTLRSNFFFGPNVSFSSLAFVSFQYLGSVAFATVGTNIPILTPLVVTPNNLKIVLTTAPIPGTADGGLGTLRLYYSSGPTKIDSLNGPPGTILPNITLGSTPGGANAQHPGNVIDTIP